MTVGDTQHGQKLSIVIPVFLLDHKIDQLISATLNSIFKAK